MRCAGLDFPVRILLFSLFIHTIWEIYGDDFKNFLCHINMINKIPIVSLGNRKRFFITISCLLYVSDCVSRSHNRKKFFFPINTGNLLYQQIYNPLNLHAISYTTTHAASELFNENQLFLFTLTLMLHKPNNNKAIRKFSPALGFHRIAINSRLFPRYLRENYALARP